MTTATLEDFMAMPEPTEVDPEPEDHGNEILGPHGREALAGAEAQMVQHDPTMSLEGVVVVETSDGEVMDVEKRIAFLSPILQLGCVRPVAARRRHLLLAVSRRADSRASLYLTVPPALSTALTPSSRRRQSICTRSRLMQWNASSSTAASTWRRDTQ